MKLEQMASSYATLDGLANFLRRNFPRITASWNVEHKVDGRHNLHFESAPFDAGDFTANSGTFTVEASDVLKYEIAQLGSLCLIAFNLQSVTINGAGNELRMRIPKRLRATDKEYTGWLTINGVDNGPAQGYCVTRNDSSGGADQLALFRPGSISWSNTSNATGLRGGIIINTETY